VAGIWDAQWTFIIHGNKEFLDEPNNCKLLQEDAIVDLGCDAM
jgi:hypothetical protein